MKRHRGKVLGWLCFLAFCATIAYADWIGDFAKANIAVDGEDVIVNDDLTVLGNLTAAAVGMDTWTMENGEIVDNATDSVVQVTYDDDAASLGTLQIHSSIVATAISANDYLTLMFQAPDVGDAAGAAGVPYAAVLGAVVDKTAGAHVGQLVFQAAVAGTMTNVVRIDGDEITPVTDSAVSLGASTYRYTNAYLDLLSVAGDVTLANEELISNAVDGEVTIAFNDDAVELGSLDLYSSLAASGVEDNDYLSLGFWAKDSAEALDEYAQISGLIQDELAGAEYGELNFKVKINGTLTKQVILDSDELKPVTDVAINLGDPTHRYGTVYASSVLMTNKEYTFKQGGKVGATAGWTVDAASNLHSYILPAGQTNATLVIPVDLPVGFTVTAIGLIGQVEGSANNAAYTIDYALRSVQAVAADVVDASELAGTQIDVTDGDADVKLDPDVHTTTGSVLIDEDKGYYVLVTGTTDADSDVVIIGIQIKGTTI